MNTPNAIAVSGEGWDADDAFKKVLGRVADAFDNPSLHTMDELKLIVVNVVKSRHLLARCPSEESMRGSSVLQQKDDMYDVTKLLLMSSPLDRLDRLARVELKKTGWIERADKWTIVEMGLHGAPLPVTPPKIGLRMGEDWAARATPNGGKQAHPRRPVVCGGPSPSSERTPERNPCLADAIKATPPPSMWSSARRQGSHSHRTDFSALACDASKASRPNATPVRASRPRLYPEGSQEQTRGRLGRVVRNIVKRMLPPPSVGGTPTRNTGYLWVRQTGNDKGEPSRRTCQAETPRSDVSAESGWSATTSSCRERCLDQAANRWSGFWH